MLFITAEQGKKHLNVDHDDDDSLIADLVQVATDVVIDYLKQAPRTTYETLPQPDPLTGLYAAPYPYPWPYATTMPYWWPVAKVSYQNLPAYITEGWVDSNGEPLAVPASVSAATKLILSFLYDDREGSSDPFSPAVESLLRRYRDPALA